MKGKRITVDKGDTLWDLARQHLGAGSEWPRLYAYNNRSEVVRKNQSRIENPDLIYPGQKLMIPIARGTRPSPKTESKEPEVAPTSLNDQLDQVEVPFSVKYELDELPVVHQRGSGFRMTLKLTGDVVIELGRKVPLSTVSNRGLETAYKAETKAALQDLVSEAKVEWDQKTNKITYSSNLTLKAKGNNGPKTTIGVELSSNSPAPKIRGQLVFPKLKGRIHGKPFLATNIKVVVEIQPEPNTKRVSRGTRPEPVVAPNGQTVKQVTVLGIAAGLSLFVGTIVTDFFSGGLGVADDAVTIPASLAMMGISVKTANELNETEQQ